MFPCWGSYFLPWDAANILTAYWAGRKGFFTINNLKAANKEAGIVAINPSGEALHIQVICSITGIDGKQRRARMALHPVFGECLQLRECPVDFLS